MFIYRFIRWLLGYIRFTATGGFPERFINLCSNNGIVIWNLKSCDGVLYANTSINGYRNIRPIARKSGMKVRISRRHGLPFFLHRYRRRVGLVLGLAFFLLLVSYLSGMVWNVRVEGNDKVRDDIIISAFETAGVYVGARTKSLDTEAIEKNALNNLNSIMWVSLNIDGSTVVIEVREKITAPSVEDNSAPTNIVAAKSGQIIVLEPYEGTANVGLNTAVVKGDLIISSVTENKDATVAFHHARGYVVARTEQTVEAAQNISEEVSVYTGERSHYTLYFFGLKIPIGPCIEPKGDYEQYDSETRLEIQGIKLPVSVKRRNFLIYETAEKQNTPEQAGLKAVEAFINSSSVALAAAKVLEEDISLSETEKGVTASGIFICNENIGQEKSLQIEQDGSVSNSE